MNILPIIYFFGLCLVCFCSGAKRKAQGKISYGANWSGGFKICENFKDTVMDVTPLRIDKLSAVSTILSGEFEYTKPIMPGTSMFVTVEKETAQGKILAFTFELPDLCEHVPDLDQPWSAFFDQLNLEERKCPLPAGVYPLDNLKLDMSSADGFFSHENVGEYVATITMSHAGKGLDVISHPLACYTFNFAVVEVRDQNEESAE